MGRIQASCDNCNWVGWVPEVMESTRGKSICPNCHKETIHFHEIKDGISGLISDIIDKDNKQLKTMASIFQLHIRALCAHCECLGMNAENSLAVCRNRTPPYSDDHYLGVLRKWGLVDEKGKPTI